MTVASLLRALLRRALTDPAGASRQVLSRLRHDPLWVLVKAGELLGPRTRSVLYRPVYRLASWGRRRFPPVGGWTLVYAFVAHGLGYREDAVAALRRQVGAPSSARVGLARLSTELDEPRLALDLLAPLEDAPAVLGARGRARERAGDLRAALSLYDRCLAERRDTVLRRRRDRLREDLRALEPDFEPRVPAPLAAHAPRPGRILHLLNNSLPQTVAGYTVRAHRTMRAQRAIGLDPLAVTKLGFPWAQGYFDARGVDEVDGIAYRHVRCDRVRDLGTGELVEHTIKAIAPIVAESGAAVLHPTTPFDNAQAALGLREISGVPVVYEVRGFLEDTWLSRYPRAAADSDRYVLHRETEGRVAAAADHVVTLGEAMKADLVARGVEAARVSVVPNAVDPRAFTPRGPDAALARALGLEGRTVLGYVSSLVPYEGVEYLLEATALLRGRGVDVAVLVVGDGTDRARLEERAGDLGLGRAARFVGRVHPDEVQRYYELVDVFVVPRTTDRVCRYVTPLKPVEAMALERCVVVSDIPALAEIVSEGETGFTFTAEDATSLANVVEPLVADPVARREVGRNAREVVVSHRTWRDNAERYRAIYESVGAL